jgi:hypothetical protein
MAVDTLLLATRATDARRGSTRLVDLAARHDDPIWHQAGAEALAGRPQPTVRLQPVRSVGSDTIDMIILVGGLSDATLTSSCGGGRAAAARRMAAGHIRRAVSLSPFRRNTRRSRRATLMAGRPRSLPSRPKPRRLFRMRHRAR